MQQRAQLAELLEPVLPRAAGALKPKEVAQLLRQRQIVFVDTRPAEVFARAHLPGAINIPQTEIEARANELMELPAAPVDPTSWLLHEPAAAPTVTVFESLPEPPAPVQVSVNVVVTESAGLVAVPLVLLYELSVLMSGFAYRKRMLARERRMAAFEEDSV